MKTITLVLLLTLYLPYIYAQPGGLGATPVKPPKLLIESSMFSAGFDLVSIKKNLKAKGFDLEKTNKTIPNTIEYVFGSTTSSNKVYLIFNSFGVTLKCNLTASEYGEATNYISSIPNQTEYYFNDNDTKFCMLSKRKFNPSDTLKYEITQTTNV
jgi:hypothetical protein